ncbi:MAG: NFACT RNA binding domain-containing protein [Campylobacterota bacterium]|nr:NFACT RNA binding domain-containing protein [Campylobacterota bacterium]
MKHYELLATIRHLKQYNFITKARRIEDNTIELNFNRGKESYFFNMTRGHSFIYLAPSLRPPQSYQAPFDNLLFSLVSSAKILDVELVNNDRVIRFALAPKSNYKDKVIYLQFEFTGKNTNAILIDSEEYVLEALRHIDSDSSFRVVRPQVKLEAIPLREPKASSEMIEDVEAFLKAKYQTHIDTKINAIKKQKAIEFDKKIAKLQKEIDKLPSVEALEVEYQKYNNCANIILANLYAIKPYDKKLEAYDFEGNPITIALPKNIKVNRMSEYYFNKAKRAKNRAKNIYIEKENLSSKLNFYANIKQSIQDSNNMNELELLAPKRAKSQKKKAKIKECELFWIDDYKVLIGRNSNENQKLLQLAKANDLWMHIRDMPSSHLVIKTDKQNLPAHVIQAAAKLCVDFSTKTYGDFDVDYTKRKFVKVQEGSNVLYNKYDTIRVTKEGVEIRE